MSRIASLAANNQLVTQLLNTQANIQETQVQLASGKKAQTYSGIAQDAESVVNVEDARNALNRFVNNNQVMQTRLDVTASTLDGIDKVLRDFRGQLSSFQSFQTQDPQRIQDIQDAAFRTLKTLESYLNTQADGRFVFSGARIGTSPADLNLTTLSDLQAAYDGVTVTVPTTRDAHLANFSISQDTVTNQTNFLTFERDDGTGPPPVGRITATSNGVFSNLKAGTTITVSGTASNDGTYTIQAVDSTNGRYIQVVTEMLTDENNVQADLTDPDGTVFGASNTGDLTFTRATDTITAANAGSLSTIPVGKTITISGSASNDGTYTVESNDGTNIVVKAKKLTDEGGVGTETLNFTSAAAEVSFVDNAPANDTIVAAAGRFSNLAAGMQVTIAGATDAGNNTTFTVDSVSTDGSTITVTGNVVARANDPATVSFLTQEAGGTIAATSYYRGDQVSLTHRVDANQDFSLDVNASDPAFEKAIRAIFLIAQGVTGTEGGLDQNQARIGQAISLLDSALDPPTGVTLPFGTELSSNVKQVQMDVGFNQVLINDTNERHQRLIATLDSRVADTENVDQTEAITKLLHESQALQASFQALARIREISLTNYL